MKNSETQPLEQAPPNTGQTQDPASPGAEPQAGGDVPPTGGDASLADGPESAAAGQGTAQFQPVGMVMDTRSGQMYYTIPVNQPGPAPADTGQAEAGTVSPEASDAQAQQPVAGEQTAPQTQAPPQTEAQTAPQPDQAQVPPGQVYMQQPYIQQPYTQPLNPPDYSQLIKSVEEFAEGDATVGDVIKTLYANTAQDDQFWKGAVVGAAATVLLTSETLRGAMAGTFGTMFGKSKADGSPAPDAKKDTKTTDKKEEK